MNKFKTTEKGNNIKKRVALAALLASIMIGGYAAAPPSSSAHARCDMKNHRHWHWAGGHYDYWRAGYSSYITVKYGKDYTAVGATNVTHGTYDSSRCYW